MTERKRPPLPPLHGAVLASDVAGVQRLASAGANVNEPVSGDQRSPLHLAVAFGAPEMVEALLRAGANPNALDVAGRTPLHIAVIGKRWEYLDLLLKHHGDPNAVDERGATPLTLAVSSDRSEDAHAVVALLRAGGDPEFAPGGTLSARDCVREISKGNRGTGFPAYAAVMNWGR